MGSQIVAVRKNLIAALAALPEYTTMGSTGQKPDCSWVWRGAQWKRREKVWTQRALMDSAPASMRAGKTFTNETATFELKFAVHGVGVSMDDAAERCLDLAEVARDFIQTHASWANNAMGVGLKEFLIHGDGQMLEGYADSDGQPLVEITQTVRFKTRLT